MSVLALGACTRKTPVVEDAGLPPVVAVPRSVLKVASVTCAPTDLCPVFPEFPVLADLYVENGRVCAIANDRAGCLEDDGWHFTARERAYEREGTNRGPRAPYGNACGLRGWTISRADGTRLFWAPNGERRVMRGDDCGPSLAVPFPSEMPVPPASYDANNPSLLYRADDDVWAYWDRGIAHFDGTRWDTAHMPKTCTNDDERYGAAVVETGNEVLWFSAADGNDGRHALVRVEPKKHRAAEVEGLDVRMIAKTGEHAIKTTARGEPRPIRAAFDGVLLAADTPRFREVDRFAGGTWVPILDPESLDARAFFAPAVDDVWMGGELGRPVPGARTVVRWDGHKQLEVVFRPDHPDAAVTAIGGSAPNDVWIASATPKTFAHRLSHWDGRVWTQTDLPDDVQVAVESVTSAAPDEAWLLTGHALWRWDGKIWTIAKALERPRGWVVTVAGDSVWVSGNEAIYRRPR